MRVLFLTGQLNFAEPMGVMQLSAILRSRGHETGLVVARTDDVAAEAGAFKPDLVLASTMTSEVRQCLEAVGRIRERVKAPVVMGGAHPTFYPQVADDDRLDAVCLGEGEEAVLDIVEAVEQGRGFEGIPNVLTSSRDELVLRPFVPDLDALPFIDREIVYVRDSFRNFGIRSFMTGRGCIYNCTYCFNAGYKKLYRGKGKVFRRRSVGSIMEEIAQVRNDWRTDFIRFSDDTFIYRLDEWSVSFLERYPEEVGLPFYCLLRADNMTRELARLLRRAGCRTVCMSIESSDDEVRNKLLKRRVSREQLKRAFALLHDEGIKTKTSCMYCLPGTTFKQDMKTMEFAAECRVDSPMFNTFMPYPGTELGQVCVERDEYDGDLEKVLSFQQLSPLSGFGHKDKVRRHNLMLLSTFLCKARFLRGRLLERLLDVKPNRLYYLINFLCMGYYNRKAFHRGVGWRGTWEAFRDFVRYYLSMRQK